jgi:transcriptional regulator with XRE-family HTH domain
MSIILYINKDYYTSCYKKMTHTAIKNNINRLLQERSWKVADLENKIGHSRPVKNILSGASKNPTIEILTSIARAFNVEIQDLLIEQNTISSVNLTLLADISTKVIQEIDLLSHSITITHNHVMLLIKEVYEYSVQLKLNSADINFIRWRISQYYKQ